MRTRHINREVVLKKMAGKPIEVYSFFSGAGFLDLGFEKAGFDIVFVNEFNKQFLDVYQYARRNNESYHSMVIVMRTLEFFCPMKIGVVDFHGTMTGRIN